MIRLFAALELPGDARAALAAWGARAVGRDPAVRLVSGDALHVTLVFLGSQKDEDVSAIAAAVTGAARPIAPLWVTGAAWLPPRRPGVLVADLAPGERLLAMQAELADALSPWHEREDRDYRPHVTVARVRRGQRLERREVVEPPALAIVARALVLYRSHQSSHGAHYEMLASAPLA